MASNLSLLSSVSVQKLVLAALVSFPTIHLFQAYQKYLTLSAIPTVGCSGFFSSYVAGMRFISSGQDIIQRGWERHYGHIFKVAEPTDWLLVVSGEKLIQEVRKIPDDVLSMVDALDDFMHGTYTMGKQVMENRYLVDVVRGTLTRNMAAHFPDLHEEAALAVHDLIPQSKGGVPLGVWDLTLHLVGRTANRYFLGSKLGRDTKYTDFCIKAATNIFVNGFALNAFPTILHPVIGPFMSTRKSNITEGALFLGSLIQERLNMDAEHGARWEGRPDDVISWLLDGTNNENERTVDSLITRVMIVNAVSLHTTSMGLSFALLALGEHPECVRALRDEVRSVTSAEGWTKNSMSKLVKLDSFLKESSRFYVGSIIHRCKARKEFELSDGTVVPVGATLGLAWRPTHYDDAHYTKPHEFNAWRYLGTDHDLGLQDEGKGRKQMANPSHDFLVFGIGRHACPGRFFAVNELKLLLGLILFSYDVSLETGNGEKVPPTVWVLTNLVPNEKAKLVFTAIA